MKGLPHIILRRFFTSVSNQSGFALIITLMVMASLAAMGIWGVRASLIDSKITSNYCDSIQTLYLAEAGIERAVDEMKNGSTSFNDILVGSDGISGTADDGILSFGSPVSLGNGTYSVKVIDNNDGDSDLFNDSDGRVVVASTGNINGAVKVVEVDVKDSPSPLFSKGIFAEERITLSSNARVDSYDSEMGTYGGDNIGSNGDVGTNAVSTSPAAISLSSNARIYGDAFVGEGGNPDAAISLSSNAEITGVKTAVDSPHELPSIPVPTVSLPEKDPISLGGNSQESVSGSGEYSSIILDSNATLNINCSGETTVSVTTLSLNSNTKLTLDGSGEVVIITDSLSLSSNSQLIIEPNITKVTIYVSNSLSLSSNTKINNKTQNPTKVAILGADSLTSCNFSSNSDYYGTLYAKNSDITISSNAEIYGAVVGKRVTLSSNARIHYDEALEKNGPAAGSGSVKVLSWREKWG